MKYIFHSEAYQEYSEATIYYKERSFSLAVAFVEEVEKSIINILSNPKICRTIEEDVRRYLLLRFPYGIYYTIEDDYILIVVVMHLSRKLGYWKDRISNKQNCN